MFEQMISRAAMRFSMDWKSSPHPRLSSKFKSRPRGWAAFRRMRRRVDSNPRQRKYVEGRVRGKTKTQAALEAGYAKSVARNAKDRIETADVHAA
jgi:uncharacterized membrane-anchored protein